MWLTHKNKHTRARFFARHGAGAAKRKSPGRVVPFLLFGILLARQRETSFFLFYSILYFQRSQLCFLYSTRTFHTLIETSLFSRNVHSRSLSGAPGHSLTCVPWPGPKYESRSCTPTSKRTVLWEHHTKMGGGGVSRLSETPLVGKRIHGRRKSPQEKKPGKALSTQQTSSPNL